jgi:hypothetical protein
MKRHRTVLYGLARIVAATLTVAPATAATAGGTPAGPNVNSASDPHRADPVISKFIKKVGPATIRNQDASTKSGRR